MTFWDYLSSPSGDSLEHALILLVLAVAGYFSYLARRDVRENRKMLNSHLEEHVNNAKCSEEKH